MEDTLRGYSVRVDGPDKTVLILVLMEDTLRDILRDGFTMKINLS